MRTKNPSNNKDYRRLIAQETLIVDVTELICEAMAKEDVNKTDLGVRIGKGKSHITQLLSGDRNLTLRTMAELAFALDRKFVVSLEPISKTED